MHHYSSSQIFTGQKNFCIHQGVIFTVFSRLAGYFFFSWSSLVLLREMMLTEKHLKSIYYSRFGKLKPS